MSRLWVGRLSRAAHVQHDIVAERDGAVLGVLEAGDAAQQRRLPAAARPEQHQQHAVVDREVDTVDRHDLVLAGIDLQQILDPQRLHNPTYIFLRESRPAAHTAMNMPTKVMTTISRASTAACG